jgi:hypothetical protein
MVRKKIRNLYDLIYKLLSNKKTRIFIIIILVLLTIAFSGFRCNTPIGSIEKDKIKLQDLSSAKRK